MSSFLQFLDQVGVLSLLALSLTLLASIFLLKKWFSRTSSSLPCSPPKLPIIGNLHQIGIYPHRSLQTLSQTHGPIMLLHFGSAPVLVISSANMAREILKTHDRVFADRPDTKINRMLLYDQKDIATAPHGEYWRQIKSFCVLNLLSNRRVQSYREVREEEVAHMIDTIKNSSSSSSPVNLSELITTLTYRVITRVALGKKSTTITTAAGRTFQELMRDFTALLGGFYVGDYIQWLGWVNIVSGLYARAEKVAKEIDGYLENVIEQHLISGGRSEDDDKDFVGILLSAQDENSTSLPADKTCLKPIILDVFAGGTDTTATAIEWVMTELLRHPESLKQAQMELREIAKNKPFIHETDLSKLQYLKAVIKEALRLHPPIPLLLPRVAKQDVNLKGYEIASGTQVIINAFAIGRDPEIWDQPEEFFPDRFLNSHIDFKGQDLELIPFGSGRRICPGINFAVSIGELALANLLYMFDWDLHGIVKAEDLDITESTGLTTRRKLPLIAVPTSFDY